MSRNPYQIDTALIVESRYESATSLTKVTTLVTDQLHPSISKAFKQRGFHDKTVKWKHVNKHRILFQGIIEEWDDMPHLYVSTYHGVLELHNNNGNNTYMHIVMQGNRMSGLETWHTWQEFEVVRFIHDIFLPPVFKAKLTA